MYVHSLGSRMRKAEDFTQLSISNDSHNGSSGDLHVSALATRASSVSNSAESNKQSSRPGINRVNSRYSIANIVASDITLQKASELLHHGREQRKRALARLSETAFFDKARRKKYTEGAMLLERAGSQLQAANLRLAIQPKNHTSCLCKEVADCFQQAGDIAHSKLHLDEQAFRLFFDAAKTLYMCQNDFVIDSFETFRLADACRKTANLSSRDDFYELADFAMQLGETLWQRERHSDSVFMLEMSLLHCSKALLANWTVDLSEKQHHTRLILADRVTMLQIEIEGKLHSASYNNASIPSRQADHWGHAKDLYEQGARHYPGRYLLQREVHRTAPFNKFPNICELIAAYTVERDTIVNCLFKAALCDLIISVKDRTLPENVLDCPKILRGYMSVSRTFSESAECRFLRSISGLLQTSLMQPPSLTYIISSNSPNLSSSPLQINSSFAAWLGDLLQEFNAVSLLFYKQHQNILPATRELIGHIPFILRWSVNRSSKVTRPSFVY